MLNISRQAYFFTIVVLITSLINLIVCSYLFGLGGLFAYTLIFIIFIPFLLVSIYNLDCLSTGHCEIWSWVLSILSVVYMLYLTISMIFLASIKDDDEEIKKKVKLERYA
jgi:O-antigen/teichoic acid export membrane protein